MWPRSLYGYRTVALSATESGCPPPVVLGVYWFGVPGGMLVAVRADSTPG
jgi:hypothetical protein